MSRRYNHLLLISGQRLRGVHTGRNQVEPQLLPQPVSQHLGLPGFLCGQWASGHQSHTPKECLT
jgi:hypothetical protein